MKTVKDLLAEKSATVWSISPKAKVFDALKLMSEKSIGALMVMADKSKVAGIITERDYARKVILQGRSSESTRVEEIMTANVVCVSPRAKSRDCMALMSEKNIRHLPVVDEGRVIGMVSVRDIVTDIIADQDFTISQLEQYISGQ